MSIIANNANVCEDLEKFNVSSGLQLGVNSPGMKWEKYLFQVLLSIKNAFELVKLTKISDA